MASNAVAIIPSAMTDEDKAALAAQMEAKIATATTVDEVFAESSTLGLEDIAGVPVTVNSVRFIQSAEQYAKAESSTGYFVVMVTDHGIVTTGARTVVQKLYKTAELGGFPLTLRFWQNDKETSRGYRPWNVSLARD